MAEGQRGVWERPFGPGKYAFNTYAGQIVLVPTTNFVLHWVTGRSETHRYDDSLRSIDLVTRDAYEPRLPLPVVVHIDYQRAPNVIQRFGDVKKLITQTLDPLLSAYFRDIAHKKTMLELLHDRDLIQAESREELRRKLVPLADALARRLSVDRQLVGEALGIFVGRIDVQLALGADDPVRRDVAGVEARDERRDAFTFESQKRGGGLVDLAERRTSGVDRDGHHLFRLGTKQVPRRVDAVHADVVERAATQFLLGAHVDGPHGQGKR